MGQEMFVGASQETPWEWALARRRMFTDPVRDVAGGVVLGVVTAIVDYFVGTKEGLINPLLTGVVTGVVGGLVLPFGEGLFWLWRRDHVLREEAEERESRLREELDAAKAASPTKTHTESSKVSSVADVKSALATIGNEEYRVAVAEVIHAVEPRAFITVGGQMHGLDGMRTVDVQVLSEGSLAPILVDVVDRPDGSQVQIESVDSAESKGRDLRAKAMLLCSNTGFTEAAIHKAKRVGVGLIAVLRQGDGRIRSYLQEEIYLRTIHLLRFQTQYTHATTIGKPKPVAFNDVTFKGHPIDEWLNAKAAYNLFGVSKTSAVRVFYRLKQPTDLNSPGRKLRGIIEIAMLMDVKVEWASQTVQIEAGRAIFDYVRGTLRLSHGDNVLEIKGVNFDTAKPMPEPPPDDRRGIGSTFLPNESDFAFVRFKGLRSPKPPSDVITALVMPEDLASDPAPISSMRRP